MDNSNVIARLRQCSARCNTCFLGPIRCHNPNSISIGSAMFAQLTVECHRACPGMSFPLKIADSHAAIWTQSYTWFLEPISAHNPNSISIGSAVFAQLTAERPHTPQCVHLAARSPLKIALPMDRSRPPSNTSYPGPIRAQNPNRIWISSAIFSQLTAECPHTLKWVASSPSK